MTLDGVKDVWAYHARTKHHRSGFAKGPETIDWSSPPDPFRRFAGAPVQPLALCADQLGVAFAELGTEAVPVAPLDAAAVGALLELSFALSAWKTQGPDRWALRCNPSSGNLHPTEAYVITRGVAGLRDAVWHYDPLDHALEQRCLLQPQADAGAGLWIGLSSIHWREAWKYGERAFRYCQLDLGHALGAVRYAAACLGWTAQVTPDGGSEALARLLGLNRAQDFLGVEPEDPECLLQIGPPRPQDAAPALPVAGEAWSGRANRLDPHPMYAWPVIGAAALASHRPATAAGPGPSDDPTAPNFSTLPRTASPASPQAPAAGTRAVQVIQQRRSAQAYTRRHLMPASACWALCEALIPPGLPWDVRDQVPRVHALAMIHRVEGVTPGLYALPRSAQGASALRAALPQGLSWEAPDLPGAPAALRRLKSAEFGATARLLSCTQAIAQDACVAWIFLADRGNPAEEQPWHYRDVHQEAGLMGQVLYLQAEAHGLRGTGIGCFFDDEVHTMLGLQDGRFQVVYHFSVGLPLTDPRIQDSAGYDDARRAWRPTPLVAALP